MSEKLNMLLEEVKKIEAAVPYADFWKSYKRRKQLKYEKGSHHGDEETDMHAEFAKSF